MRVKVLQIGDRVRYRPKTGPERQGTIAEIRPRTDGVTGRATARVDWDEAVVQDWKHGESSSWVSLSSLRPA